MSHPNPTCLLCKQKTGNLRNLDVVSSQLGKYIYNQIYGSIAACVRGRSVTVGTIKRFSVLSWFGNVVSEQTLLW